MSGKYDANDPQPSYRAFLNHTSNTKHTPQTGSTFPEHVNFTFQGEANITLGEVPSKTKTTYINDKESVGSNVFSTQYDPMTGVRTAAILGSFLLILMFYIIYKSKCKAQWSNEEDVYYDDYQKKYQEKLLNKDNPTNKEECISKPGTNSLEKTRNWIHTQPLYTAIPECNECVVHSKVRHYMHKKQQSVSLEDLHLALKDNYCSKNSGGYTPCELHSLNSEDESKYKNCECKSTRRVSSKSIGNALLDFNCNLGKNGDYMLLHAELMPDNFGSPLMRSMSTAEHLLHGSPYENARNHAISNMTSIPGFHDTIHQIVQGHKCRKADRIQVNGTTNGVLSLHNHSTDGVVLFRTANNPQNISSALTTPQSPKNHIAVSMENDRASSDLVNANLSQVHLSAPSSPHPVAAHPHSAFKPSASLFSVYVTPLSSPTCDIPMTDIVNMDTTEKHKNVLNTQPSSTPDYEDCPTIFSDDVVTRL